MLLNELYNRIARARTALSNLDIRLRSSKTAHEQVEVLEQQLEAVEGIELNTLIRAAMIRDNAWKRVGQITDAIKKLNKQRRSAKPEQLAEFDTKKKELTELKRKVLELYRKSRRAAAGRSFSKKAIVY